jgi:hypothetical protein
MTAVDSGNGYVYEDDIHGGRSLTVGEEVAPSTAMGVYVVVSPDQQCGGASSPTHSTGQPSGTSQAVCSEGPGQCPRCAPQMYAIKSARHRAEFDSFEDDGIKR